MNDRGRFIRLAVMTVEMKEALKAYAEKNYKGFPSYDPPIVGMTFLLYLPTVEAAHDAVPLVVAYGDVAHLKKIREVCAAANAEPPEIPLTTLSDVSWLEFAYPYTAMALRRRNVRTVADLIDMRREMIDSLSKRACADVRERLAFYGLALRADN